MRNTSHYLLAVRIEKISSPSSLICKIIAPLYIILHLANNNTLEEREIEEGEIKENKEEHVKCKDVNETEEAMKYTCLATCHTHS